MPEYSQQQMDYAKYRLERSQEDLQCAEKLFEISVYIDNQLD